MAAPSASLRSKIALDELVRKYLKAEGDGGPPMKMEDFEAAYFCDVVRSSPQSSADLVTVPAFEQLLAWVDSSLDVLKPELLVLAYHLFIKSYIRLIQKARHDDASVFWLEFSSRFLGEGHGEHMREVALLTDSQQVMKSSMSSLLSSSLSCTTSFLDSHPVVKRTIEEKVCLKLSSGSLIILKNFLIDSNLIAILSILNAEFHIDTKVGNNAGNGGDFPQCNRAEKDLVPIDWRAPGHISKFCHKRKRESSAESKLPAISDDNFYKSLIDHIIIPNVISSQANDKEHRWSMTPPHSTGNLQRCLDDPSVIFATFTNSYGSMTCLHLTQDSKMAVAGFSDCSNVLVWNWGARSGYPSCSFSRTLPTSQQDTNNVIATQAGGSNELRQERKRSEEASNCLVGHSQRVCAVSVEEFSGDNRYVLSASADETVRLWDTRSEALTPCLACYPCAEGIPWSVEFGPFGYYFLVGNQGGSAVLHSTDRLSPLRVFRGHSSDVTCSSFHPNAAYVATGSSDGSVRMWDIRDANKGSVRHLSVSLNHDGINSLPSWFSKRGNTAVTSVKCSPCGGLLAAGFEDGTAAIWDVSSGRLSSLLHDPASSYGKLKSAEQVGSTAHSSIYALQFDSDASHLVTGGHDCAVKLWDVQFRRGVPSERNQNSQLRDDGEISTLRLIAPRDTFHTKFTPVYALSRLSNFKERNVFFAGGPSSLCDVTT